MRFSLFLGAFLGALSTTAWCSRFNLDPWILIFEPQKKIISHTVTFKYQQDAPASDKKDAVQGPVQAPAETDNNPVPVEINIAAREVTSDGVVTYPNTVGADNFVVYPSQFILYPGDIKKIQVQWVGSTVPKKEISFGFISTQVPLNFKTPKEKPVAPTAKVAISTRYEGIIVVRPADVSPQVIVDTAYSRKDSTGMSLVTVLENQGTGTQALKDMRLTLVALDNTGKLNFSQRKEIPNLKSQAVINQSLFAGFKRTVVLPWPADFPIGPVKVTPAFPDAKK